MTTQPPDPPSPQQVNTHGAIGFQNGNHVHNYGGGYPAGAASMASRRATNQGIQLGPPITGWGPADLGVHASITVHDETTLPPYLARPHDQQLRDHLAQARGSDRSTLVLVAGTSCTGKTRTLYEATTAVLPDWALTAPRRDSELAQLLLGGVPARTLVWLDELQDRLTTTTDGITAAKAITELVQADHLGPIVFAGTIWPTNLTTLQARPDPAQAAAGAGAIPDLLRAAALVEVPDTFTDHDLNAAAADIQDPRLRKAIDTATQTDHPEHGRKLTQVLAGGTQLLARLYPAAGTHPVEPFTPAAKAVLHAAADLRRVGMPNPLPIWAIEGAAPGYLDPPDERPPKLWLPSAIAETTRAATQDDPVTGIHSLDIHTEGIPALTPRWSGDADGSPTFGVDLHDYLFQDHLTRRRMLPTAPELWATIVRQSDSLDEDTAFSVWQSAQLRGLFSWSLSIARPRNGHGNPWAWQLTESVAAMDDAEGLQLLLGSGGGLYPISPLVEYYATRGDKAALLEMHLAEHERTSRPRTADDDASEGHGLWPALSEVWLDERLQAWRHRGAIRPQGWWEPTVGASEPTHALLDLLVQDGDLDNLQELFVRGVAYSDRALSNLLLSQGDEAGLLQLVHEDGVEYALARLADLYIERDRTEDLDRLPDTRDRYVSTERLRYYRRHDDRARLESALETDPGDTVARDFLIDLFVEHRDEQALLRLREAHRFPVLDRLADIRRALRDEAGLQELTSYQLPRGESHEYPLRQWIELLVDVKDEKGLRGFRHQGHDEVLQRVVRGRAKRHDLEALEVLARAGTPDAAEALRVQLSQAVEDQVERQQPIPQDTIQLTQLVHAGKPGAAKSLIALLRAHSDLDGPAELDEAAMLIPARTLFRPSTQ